MVKIWDGCSPVFVLQQKVRAFHCVCYYLHKGLVGKEEASRGKVAIFLHIFFTRTIACVIVYNQPTLQDAFCNKTTF